MPDLDTQRFMVVIGGMIPPIAKGFPRFVGGGLNLPMLSLEYFPDTGEPAPCPEPGQYSRLVRATFTVEPVIGTAKELSDRFQQQLLRAAGRLSDEDGEKWTAAIAKLKPEERDADGRLQQDQGAVEAITATLQAQYRPTSGGPYRQNFATMSAVEKAALAFVHDRTDSGPDVSDIPSWHETSQATGNPHDVTCMVLWLRDAVQAYLDDRALDGPLPDAPKPWQPKTQTPAAV